MQTSLIVINTQCKQVLNETMATLYLKLRDNEIAFLCFLCNTHWMTNINSYCFKLSNHLLKEKYPNNVCISNTIPYLLILKVALLLALRHKFNYEKGREFSKRTFTRRYISHFRKRRTNSHRMRTKENIGKPILAVMANRRVNRSKLSWHRFTFWRNLVLFSPTWEWNETKGKYVCLCV